jgi:hypothetical protein
MNNPFTIGGGVNGYNPSLVGGTGSGTAKIFPSLLGTGFDNGGGTLPQPSGVVAAECLIPGTGQFEQQIISVEAAGYVFVHGTSPTINFVFQQGSSLTPGSNTTMATLTSNQSLTTGATYPWAFKCQLQGDSVSGILQIMNATFYCNGVSGTLTLTDLTGVNLTTTNYPFVCGIEWGVSDSLNKAALSSWGMQ